MAQRKSTKKGAGDGKPNRRPTKRQLLTAEGVAQGKSLHRAALDAGYSPHTAKSMIYKTQENARILEAVENRKAEAMRRAQIHTDIIVGSLAEIATASLADVVPDDPFLRNAKKSGTDHLIKKVKVNYDTKGNIKSREYEMYSRLEALNQLRDTFGMKQEPRANTFDETRRAEVERSIHRIMERDGVDQPTAAKTLLAELGDVPELAPIVSSYAN